MLQPLARRTWALRGKTPLLDNWDRHDRFTSIGALTIDPFENELDFFFDLSTHNAKAEDFVWFLRQLHEELHRRLLVVWDRLSAHRKAARLLRNLDCSWVRFEELPPYCPDLNPVEHVWALTKWGKLPNWPPDDAEMLRCGVEKALNEQACDDLILQSHFEWAQLDLDEL